MFAWMCLRICVCFHVCVMNGQGEYAYGINGLTKCVGRTLIQKIFSMQSTIDDWQWADAVAWKLDIVVLLWWIHPCRVLQTHIPFDELLSPGRILAMSAFHLLLRTLPNNRYVVPAPSISHLAQPNANDTTYLTQRRTRKKN